MRGSQEGTAVTNGTEIRPPFLPQKEQVVYASKEPSPFDGEHVPSIK